MAAVLVSSVGAVAAGAGAVVSEADSSFNSSSGTSAIFSSESVVLVLSDGGSGGIGGMASALETNWK